MIKVKEVLVQCGIDPVAVEDDFVRSNCREVILSVIYGHEEQGNSSGRYVRVVDNKIQFFNSFVDYGCTMLYDYGLSRFFFDRPSDDGIVLCLNEIDAYLLCSRGIRAVAVVNAVGGQPLPDALLRMNIKSILLPSIYADIRTDDRYRLVCALRLLKQLNIGHLLFLKHEATLFDFMAKNPGIDVEATYTVSSVPGIDSIDGLVEKYFPDTFANRAHVIKTFCKEVNEEDHEEFLRCNVTSMLIYPDRSLGMYSGPLQAAFREQLGWLVGHDEILSVVETSGLPTDISLVERKCEASIDVDVFDYDEPVDAKTLVRRSFEMVDSSDFDFFYEMLIKHLLRSLHGFVHYKVNPYLFVLVGAGGLEVFQSLSILWSMLSLHERVNGVIKGPLSAVDLIEMHGNRFFIVIEGADTFTSFNKNFLSQSMRFGENGCRSGRCITDVRGPRVASYVGVVERPISFDFLQDQVISFDIANVNYDHLYNEDIANVIWGEVFKRYDAGETGELSDDDKFVMLPIGRSYMRTASSLFTRGGDIFYSSDMVYEILKDRIKLPVPADAKDYAIGEEKVSWYLEHLWGPMDTVSFDGGQVKGWLLESDEDIVKQLGTRIPESSD